MTGLTFSGSDDTTCPRNVTSLLRKWHLVDINLKPSVLIRSSTYRRWRMWSLKVRAQMMNARQCVRVRPLSVRFISRVTLAGPFVNPKGISLLWDCPWWVEKAVLGQSSSLTCICQYPEAKSRLEPHRNPLTRRPSKVVVWHPSLSTGNVYGSQCMYGMSRHVS